MPNNKEGMLLRYRETHTHVVDDTTIYPGGDMEAAATGVADAIPDLVAKIVMTVARPATAPSCWSAVAQSSTVTARSYSTQDDPNTFALDPARDPAASHASPANPKKISLAAAGYPTTSHATTACAIVAPPVIVAHVTTTNDGLSDDPPHAPPLDWGDTPFDVGIHFDLNAPAIPLYHMGSDDDGESSSDVLEIEIYERHEMPSFHVFTWAEIYYVTLYSRVDLVQIMKMKLSNKHPTKPSLETVWTSYMT
jgi:hypothetical protein